jgi:hypothetical protein
LIKIIILPISRGQRVAAWRIMWGSNTIFRLLYLNTDFKSFEYYVVTVTCITGCAGLPTNALSYIFCYLLEAFQGWGKWHCWTGGRCLSHRQANIAVCAVQLQSLPDRLGYDAPYGLVCLYVSTLL